MCIRDRISLSIDKGGVSGDMQFKDGNKKQSQLFNFSGNKVKSSGSSKPVSYTHLDRITKTFYPDCLYRHSLRQLKLFKLYR